MNGNLIGKTLSNEKDELFVVLKELTFKSINYVYAMKVENDKATGEKTFYQITLDKDNLRLCNIASKKLLNLLSEALFKESETSDTPRKIKDGESVEKYLSYLNDFYKSKVVTII